MSDFKKGVIAGQRSDTVAAIRTNALRVATAVLHAPVPGASGLPPGVSVQTNAKTVARFPLPLTMTSAVMLAVGAIAYMRGHRIVGGLLAVAGVAGIGAAAAAPELHSALTSLQSGPAVGAGAGAGASGPNLAGIT